MAIVASPILPYVQPFTALSVPAGTEQPPAPPPSQPLHSPFAPPVDRSEMSRAIDTAFRCGSPGTDSKIQGAEVLPSEEVAPSRFAMAAAGILTLAAIAGCALPATAAPPVDMSLSMTLPVQAAAPTATPAQTVRITRADLLVQPLQKGMEGEPVRRLQEGLNRFVPVKATGVFDDQTEAAVKAFQSKNGLSNDGVVGNNTFGVLWNRLFWEKKVALSLNGPEFPASAPSHPKVVVDLARQRVNVLDADSGKVFKTYPTSSGAPAYATPKGSFKISEIREKPSWYPPPSPWARGSKVTPPGPRNPLGPVFIRVGTSNVGLHGVPPNEFDSLGRWPASHGCMRMYPQDAWELHNIVKSGTPIEIR